MLAPQWRLFFLAFSASCAGNGLIVSTLGAILGAHATASDDGGGSAIALGAGVVVSTATLNGGLLGFRWSVEGFLARSQKPRKSTTVQHFLRFFVVPLSIYLSTCCPSPY